MNSSMPRTLCLLTLLLGGCTTLFASSSSSHKTCNMKQEISEFDSEFDSCCKDILDELNQVEEFIDTNFPCDAEHPINQVPVVINVPGKYCVTKDLVYQGTGAAITVVADNVSINFYNHDLVLTNTASQGVVVQNASEFLLENDAIIAETICKSDSSVAVHLINVQKATISNIFTAKTTKGVWIENSTDVLVEHSHFESHEGAVQIVFPSPATLAGTGTGAGVWINNSAGVEMNFCTFVGADCPFDATRTGFGLHVEQNSKNIMLLNSTFSNLIGSIHAVSVTNFLIDSSLAVNSPDSTLNVVQLGSCTTGESANDVIIRNSNFIYTGGLPGVDGILLASGAGCILENLLIDTVSQAIDNTYFPGGIHVGLQGCDSGYQNVLGRFLLVKGQNYSNLNMENCQNANFERCTISDSIYANVLMNDPTTSSSIKDSQISNGQNYGVFLNTGSGGGNAVEGCQIYDNGNYGLSDSVTPVEKNFFSYNNVYDNADGIFIANSGMTMTFFNTSCNNTANNCTVFVSPTQAPGASPVEAGVNVCCP